MQRPKIYVRFKRKSKLFGIVPGQHSFLFACGPGAKLLPKLGRAACTWKGTNGMEITTYIAEIGAMLDAAIVKCQKQKSLLETSGGKKLGAACTQAGSKGGK